MFARKADWQPSLKPPIPPTKWNLDHLYRLEDEAKDFERLSKRQQGDKAYLSPDTSDAAGTAERMGPPSTSQSQVKTPRPSISIGLGDTAVISMLQSRGIPGGKAEQLLEILGTPHPLIGTPLLIFEPTQAELEIRFPFLLVEGKSYATGKTIYEEQNQAAISGACSVRILHDLDGLVRKSHPESYSKGQHVVFSVCTEGPIHQLWVHYTVDDEDSDSDRDGDSNGDNDSIYYMAQVKTCDVGICSDIPGFLEAVDNVMRWGSHKHKIATTEQLIQAVQPSS